jgi:hypothetical protein
MKLRVAKKVRKAWKEQYEYHTRYGRRGVETRQSLREVFSTMGFPLIGFERAEMEKPPRPPKFRRYTQQTVARAYYRLKGEARMDWYIDMAVLRAADRVDRMLAENPWQAAKYGLECCNTLLSFIADQHEYETDVGERMEVHQDRDQ